MSFDSTINQTIDNETYMNIFNTFLLIGTHKVYRGFDTRFTDMEPRGLYRDAKICATILEHHSLTLSSYDGL